MGRRIHILLLFSTAGWLSAWGPAWGNETLNALAIQKAALYSRKLELPETAKNEYVSQGQTLLRSYLREQMLPALAAQWFSVDLRGLENGIGLQIFSSAEGPMISNPWPIATWIRVRADEDLTHYQDCGVALPVSVEIQSAYAASDAVDFRAHFEAPLNDALRLKLGSEIRWSRAVRSCLEYRWANHLGQDYDGFHLGVGWEWDAWQVSLNYTLSANNIHSPFLGIEKSF